MIYFLGSKPRKDLQSDVEIKRKRSKNIRMKLKRDTLKNSAHRNEPSGSKTQGDTQNLRILENEKSHTENKSTKNPKTSKIAKNEKIQKIAKTTKIEKSSKISKISRSEEISDKIPHKGKGKRKNTQESDYFSCDSQNQSSHDSKCKLPSLSPFKTLSISLILTDLPSARGKTKLLSPNLFEAKERSSESKCYSGEKDQNPMKYVAIYRKSLRNCNAMNSSRTDLRSNKKNNNEYDNNYIKTSYGLNFQKNNEGEGDLVPTE